MKGNIHHRICLGKETNVAIVWVAHLVWDRVPHLTSRYTTYSTVTGGWFQPLWKIWVRQLSSDYSQYMEKHIFQTANQVTSQLGFRWCTFNPYTVFCSSWGTMGPTIPHHDHYNLVLHPQAVTHHIIKKTKLWKPWQILHTLQTKILLLQLLRSYFHV
jgi:hypothetical protein